MTKRFSRAAYPAAFLLVAMLVALTATACSTNERYSGSDFKLTYPSGWHILDVPEEERTDFLFLSGAEQIDLAVFTDTEMTSEEFQELPPEKLNVILLASGTVSDEFTEDWTENMLSDYTYGFEGVTRGQRKIGGTSFWYAAGVPADIGQEHTALVAVAREGQRLFVFFGLSRNGPDNEGSNMLFDSLDSIRFPI